MITGGIAAYVSVFGINRSLGCPSNCSCNISLNTTERADDKDKGSSPPLFAQCIYNHSKHDLKVACGTQAYF